MKTYTVTNNAKGTNWNIGAIIRRISPWEGGWAIFTDARHPGASIHAHRSEVAAR